MKITTEIGIILLLVLIMVPVVSGIEQDVIVVTDGNNHRIKMHNLSNYDILSMNGSSGSGDYQFSHPFDIYCDDIYMYIVDKNNNRIVKRFKNNYTFVSKIGTQGSGNDQFFIPEGITGDDTYLYITDSGNSRIKKHNKSDLSYVSKFGSIGSGNDQFIFPFGIVYYDGYLYIVDYSNHRIKKHNASDLSYVSQFGSSGSGDDQFGSPTGITTDGTYLYICDGCNHRIKKHSFNGTYISKIGTDGSGDDQFHYPNGIDYNNGYLYIADGLNHRIKKHLASNLSYVSKYGTLGSGNDQFNNLFGIFITSIPLHECTACTWNQTEYDVNDPFKFNYTLVDADNSTFEYSLWINDSTGGWVDNFVLNVSESCIESTIGTDYQFGEIRGCIYAMNRYSSNYTLLNSSTSYLPAHNCTNYEWNKTDYYPDDPFRFNYTLNHANNDTYEYKFIIIDPDDDIKGNYVLNVSSDHINGIMGTCWINGEYSGQIWAVNRTSEAATELCNNTTSFNFINPSASDCEMNKSVYDVREDNETFRFNYTISNPHSSCYEYYIMFIYYTDLSGTVYDTYWIDYDIDSTDNHYTSTIYTNWTEGIYSVVMGYSNGTDFIELCNDSVTILSSTKPDYYINFTKDSYQVGESVQITYKTKYPDDSCISLRWIDATGIDGGTGNESTTWSNLGSSGTIYTSFDRLGQYKVSLVYDNESTDEYLSLEDSSYGITSTSTEIRIDYEVYYFEEDDISNNVGYYASISSGKDIVVCIFNPDNVMVAMESFSYPSDFNDGTLTVNGTYLAIPTDGSGDFTFIVRETESGSNLASDTCFIKIPDYTTLDLFFYPDSITAGEDLNLYYYIPVPDVDTEYSIQIRPPLLVNPVESLLISADSSDSYGYQGYITYTVPVDRDSNTWKGVIADLDSETDNMTAYATVGCIPHYVPEEIGGINAITNLASAAGFSGETGEFIFAILVILLIMYFIGKDLDAKSQIAILSICVIGFTIIGMIPVWVLVIIAVLLGAVLTFNLTDRIG